MKDGLDPHTGWVMILRAGGVNVVVDMAALHVRPLDHRYENIVDPVTRLFWRHPGVCFWVMIAHSCISGSKSRRSAEPGVLAKSMQSCAIVCLLVGCVGPYVLVRTRTNLAIRVDPNIDWQGLQTAEIVLLAEVRPPCITLLRTVTSVRGVPRDQVAAKVRGFQPDDQQPLICMQRFEVLLA